MIGTITSVQKLHNTRTLLIISFPSPTRHPFRVWLKLPDFQEPMNPVDLVYLQPITLKGFLRLVLLYTQRRVLIHHLGTPKTHHPILKALQLGSHRTKQRPNTVLKNGSFKFPLPLLDPVLPPATFPLQDPRGTQHFREQERTKQVSGRLSAPAQKNVPV